MTTWFSHLTTWPFFAPSEQESLEDTTEPTAKSSNQDQSITPPLMVIPATLRSTLEASMDVFNDLIRPGSTLQSAAKPLVKFWDYDINLCWSVGELLEMMTTLAKNNFIGAVPVWRQFCANVVTKAALATDEVVSPVPDDLPKSMLNQPIAVLAPADKANLAKQLLVRLRRAGQIYAMCYFDLASLDDCLTMLDLAVAAAGVNDIAELYPSPEDYINMLVKNQPAYVVKLLKHCNLTSQEAHFRVKYGFSSLMVAIWLLSQADGRDASLYHQLLGDSRRKKDCAETVFALMQHTTNLNWSFVSDLVDNSVYHDEAEAEICRHALLANLAEPKTFLAVLRYVADFQPYMKPDFFTPLAANLLSRAGVPVSQVSERQAFNLNGYFGEQVSFYKQGYNLNGTFQLNEFDGPKLSRDHILALNIMRNHWQVDLVALNPALGKIVKLTSKEIDQLGKEGSVEVMS